MSNIEVSKILDGKDKLIKFLKEKGFKEEKNLSYKKYKTAIFFKVEKRDIIAVYELKDKEELKDVKNYFLIDKGLKYCLIILSHKLIFFRKFGESRYFIYSKRTKDNVSKIDKLNKLDSNSLDGLFQYKDISFEFYKEFKNKRNLLVKNINKNITPVEKFLIAQKIFDRIFFIYFLCHKNIIKFEDGRKVSGNSLFKILLKEGNFLLNLNNLFNLFNTEDENNLNIGENKFIIPYLNGGLFRPDDLEKDLDISLTNEKWTEVFKFLNNYNWVIEDIKQIDETEDNNNEDKILTPEILGHVYERSVVEWEKKGFKEEVNESIGITERKKKGVYYTPEPITDYISKNTIIPYLLDKLNNKYNSIEDLAKSKNKKHCKEAIKILNNIKILDPACGSGAFLIKASEIVYFLKRRLYNILEEKHNFYDMKLKIITENIYGVDILKGAIEISKLRLWLWLVSDFEESKGKIKALPNIEYNLKVGNSLIGWVDEKLPQMPINTPLTEKVDGIFTGLIAFSENGDEKDLKKARKLLKGYRLEDYIEAYYILYKIYRKTHGVKSENIRSILKIIKESIYSVVTPAFLDYINHKIKPKYNPKKPLITKEEFNKLQVFHWRIDFGHIIRNGGFDIVIGNPPYGNILKDIEKLIIEKSLNFYVVNSDNFGKGTKNAAGIFIERTKILNKKGYFSFIIPKAILYIENWQKVRKLLLKQVELKRVVDNSKAFKDVLLEMATIIFKNKLPKNNKVIVHNLYLYNYKKYSTKPYLMDRKYLTDKRFITEINKIRETIIKKIQEKSTPLRKFAISYRGLKQKEKYLTEKTINSKDQIKIIRGRYIFRYGIKKIIYLNKNKISKEEIKLMDKSGVIAQSIVSHIENPSPHILLMATVKSHSNYNIESVTNFSIYNKKLKNKFLVTLMNSQLINWYMYKYIYCNSIRSMRLDKYYSLEIPIPKISLSKQKPFIKLANKILNITKDEDYLENKNKQQKVKKLEKEIDQMVYKLFDLTSEEIKIIEEGK